jgi:hypothetical protein
MPETCAAEQADFRNALQQNGTAKMAAFLSPDELGELRTAVDATFDLPRQHADDDPPTLTEFHADHYKRWDGIWVKELRGYLEKVKPDLLAQFDCAIAAAERQFRSLFDRADPRLEQDDAECSEHGGKGNVALRRLGQEQYRRRIQDTPRWAGRRDPVRSFDVASHAADRTGERGAHQLRIQICPHLVTRDTSPAALVVRPHR